MAVEDANGVGSMPFMLLSSSHLKQSEDVLSHEDIAWVDSCITQDLEVLESGWDTLKQALQETVKFSAAGSDSNCNEDNEVDMLTVPSAEGSAITKLSEPADDSDLSIPFLGDKEDEDGENSPSDQSLGAQSCVRNPFLPNYKEFLDEEGSEETANMSSVFNLEIPESGTMGKDIFKVWELEIPEEEDEFAEELNTALVASQTSSDSSQLQPVNFSGQWRDGNEGLIHDLVAGIGDLSLY